MCRYICQVGSCNNFIYSLIPIYLTQVMQWDLTKMRGQELSERCEVREPSLFLVGVSFILIASEMRSLKSVDKPLFQVITSYINTLRVSQSWLFVSKLSEYFINQENCERIRMGFEPWISLIQNGLAILKPDSCLLTTLVSPLSLQG